MTTENDDLIADWRTSKLDDELGKWRAVNFADRLADALSVADRLAEEQAREVAFWKARAEDERAAHHTAAGYLDRFRDVVCEATGYPDDNPGDDTILTDLRTIHGHSGPEPTRWRDFIAGAQADLERNGFIIRTSLAPSSPQATEEPSQAPAGEEWEYQCRLSGNPWTDVSPEHRCSGERRRRRKAGSWEPVADQTTEEKR